MPPDDTICIGPPHAINVCDDAYCQCCPCLLEVAWRVLIILCDVCVRACHHARTHARARAAAAGPHLLDCLMWAAQPFNPSVQGQKYWKVYRNRNEDGREQQQATQIEASGTYCWQGRRRRRRRMMMHLCRQSAGAVRRLSRLNAPGNPTLHDVYQHRKRS